MYLFNYPEHALPQLILHLKVFQMSSYWQLFLPIAPNILLHPYSIEGPHCSLWFSHPRYLQTCAHLLLKGCWAGILFTMIPQH